MKKALLPMLFLLMMTSLFAAEVYRSNELGQKLEKEKALFGRGYELKVWEEEESLYLDGTEQFTRINFEGGHETRYPDHTVVVQTDNEGKVLRRIDGDEETNYFYEGRLLKAVNRSVDGTVTSRTEYIRSSEGILLAYRTGDLTAFVNGTVMVLSTGDDISVYGMEDGIDKIVEETEDGGYIEDDGTSRKVFDGNGRLVEEKTEGTTVSYRYGEDGALVETVETGEAEVLVTAYYGNRRVSSQTLDLQGETKRTDSYLADGTIEEIRYIGGVPRYRFLFDRDGKRILEANSL